MYLSLYIYIYILSQTHKHNTSIYLYIYIFTHTHSHIYIYIYIYVYVYIYMLYFDLRPGQKCHSKVMHRKEVTHSNGSYERKSRERKLADEMWRGKKIPMVHSYTDAPEESDLWTAWQLFLLDDDQTCDFKDRVGNWVGVELLYNSVKTEVKTVPVRVGDRDRWDVVGKATSGQRGLGAPDEFQLEIAQSYRRDVVRKVTSGWRGLGALMSWGPGKLLIRCSKESHHPAEWAPGPPVKHQENEKDTTLTAISLGSKYCSFCSVSNSLSHANFE